MVEIDSIHVSLGSRPILKNICFTVGRGEVTAMIGPNGAGKTTLIRAVSGVLKPSSGMVKIGGQDISRLSTAQRAALIAVVPQARDLPGLFTVWETVLLGRTPHLNWVGKAGSPDFSRVQWAMARVDIANLADRCVGELSGGEQQRVLLARALAQETPVLLLDEPTSSLDIKHQSILLNLVKELAREENLAVLMVLHDLNQAAVYADRVALLVDGCLSMVDRPEKVLTSEHLERAYQVPVYIVSHPTYGTPLVLPDGHILRGR